MERRSSITEIADQVRPEEIDLGDKTSPDGAVTILFSDIEGSTQLVDRLGDERWFELLRAHNEIVRRNLKACDGNEVKAQGDGFMLAFPSSRAALRCAIGIQRDLEAARDANPDWPIRVRIGLHSGFMIADSDDFFGKNVILAARIADRARGGEILVSSTLKEYAEGDRSLRFLSGQQLSLKGLTGEYVVHPVAWD